MVGDKRKNTVISSALVSNHRQIERQQGAKLEPVVTNKQSKKIDWFRVTSSILVLLCVATIISFAVKAIQPYVVGAWILFALAIIVFFVNETRDKPAR